MAEFPSGLPNFTDFNPSSTLAASNHAARHNKIHAEVAAIAEKLGADSSTDEASVDYKLAQAIADILTAESAIAEAEADIAAFTASIPSQIDDGVESYIIDEDDMASNSATKVPTQQSVRQFIKSLRPIKVGWRKTSSQVAVTNNAQTLIVFQQVEEFMETSPVHADTGGFTAPAAGWVDIAAVLSIIGGALADDSMNWGICLNGTFYRVMNDNWNYNSAGAGVEFTTSIATSFAVASGDIITLQYNGTAAGVTLMANVCHMNLTFTPNYPA